MLESRLNSWISGIVAAATLAVPTTAYAERLPTYLTESASLESRYHLLDSSNSISGIEEIAQDKKLCPPQLSYLPECQQQLRQQQPAPIYVPPNQQLSPQPTYVPSNPPQPAYQPSYSAPPEKEEKSSNGWYMVGGGVAMMVVGGFISKGVQYTHCPANSDECSSNDDVGGWKIVGGAIIVGGAALTIWGIVDLNSD